jgi:hypothetical protein
LLERIRDPYFGELIQVPGGNRKKPYPLEELVTLIFGFF